MALEETTHGIGQSILRNEDWKYLRGRGQYLSDIAMPGLKDVAFLRSPIAHARLLEVHVEDSLRTRVFTAEDLPGMSPIVATSTAPGYKVSEHPPLAQHKVRFVGEPIAACLGDTRAEAEDIVQQIYADLDELPIVIDMHDAQRGDSALVHDEWNSNIALESFIHAGDLDAARQEASVVVTQRLKMNRHASLPLEGRGVLAYWDNRLDELVVYTSTQFPHVVRTEMARLLDIPERRLRVIAPDVGGGFGVKSNLHAEELVVAALAMRTGRPVRWVEDRREHLIASQHAREHAYELTLHANAEGRLLAVEAVVEVDAGAYSVWPWTSTMEAGMAAGMVPGPYDIQVYHACVRTIMTNKSPLGPYRGVGRTGACLAIDCALDALARKVGREPWEVRTINMVRPDQMPYRSATNKVYDSGNYAESVREAVRLIDVEAVRAKQKNMPEGKVLGVGFGSYTEQTAHGTTEWVARGMALVFGYEPAVAKFTPDGDLILEVGVQNHGQGLETTLAQIAAQELGVDPKRVIVRHGDTSLSPYGSGTMASRSMVMAGGAVARACRMLAQKIRRIGAHLLKEPEQNLKLHSNAVHGQSGQITLQEVAYVALIRPERLPASEDPGLEVSTVYEPDAATGAYSYGTHAALVEVDLQHFSVRLLDYVVVHDCGRVVNPMIVEGQLLGGVAQGIGTALYEEIPYDSYGQPQASTLMDYLVPGAVEVPEVRMAHLEHLSPHTEYGIKGMGEGGAIAPPAAILNAINDALQSVGVSLNETPVTPRRIHAALRVNPVDDPDRIASIAGVCDEARSI